MLNNKFIYTCLLILLITISFLRPVYAAVVGDQISSSMTVARKEFCDIVRIGISISLLALSIIYSCKKTDLKIYYGVVLILITIFFIITIYEFNHTKDVFSLFLYEEIWISICVGNGFLLGICVKKNLQRCLLTTLPLLWICGGINRRKYFIFYNKSLFYTNITFTSIFKK